VFGTLFVAMSAPEEPVEEMASVVLNSFVKEHLPRGPGLLSASANNAQWESRMLWVEIGPETVLEAPLRPKRYRSRYVNYVAVLGSSSPGAYGSLGINETTQPTITININDETMGRDDATQARMFESAERFLSSIHADGAWVSHNSVWTHRNHPADDCTASFDPDTGRLLYKKDFDPAQWAELVGLSVGRFDWRRG
jgi:hypothetical protein